MMTFNENLDILLSDDDKDELFKFLNVNDAIKYSNCHHKLEYKYGYNYTFSSYTLSAVSFLQKHLRHCRDVALEYVLDLLHMFVWRPQIKH